MYYIRNDITGHNWKAGASEARLYAIGGIMEKSGGAYSVFAAGSMICLSASCIQ